MSRMYGDRINEFVLSVDIMNEDTFHDLLSLVSVYLHEQLQVTYFAVLEEGTVNGEPGLITLWSSRDDRPSFSVGAADGYGSFSAYAFDNDCPLWVVGSTDIELHGVGDVGEYVDRWDDAQGLPRYSPSIDGEVRTSVMYPLRRGSRPIGMIEFGCPKRIEPTPASKLEVATLADTVSRAYRMFDVRKTQKMNTERALRLLEASLNEESWKRLALPQVFVAYSGRADDEVVDTIRKVLEQYESVLRPDIWEDSTESGNINSQVVEAITSSEFGICYFSEPLEDGYDDNSNVLFEAGMMQALTNSGGALLRGWVPIREDSGAMPFDVAAERMVIVPRTEGRVDRAAFASVLRQRLDNLVGLPTDDAAD